MSASMEDDDRLRWRLFQIGKQLFDGDAAVLAVPVLVVDHLLEARVAENQTVIAPKLLFNLCPIQEFTE